MERAKEANKVFFAMIIVSVMLSLLMSVLPVHANLYTNISLSQLALIVPAIVFLVQTKGEVLKDFQIRKIGIYTVLWTLLFAILLEPTMYLLNIVSQLFAPNLIAQEMTAMTGGFWVSFLYFALLPAMVEEFLFRGFIFRSYRPAGILVSSLLTGLLFGLMHLNMNQFFYAFFMGVMFCLVDEVTGSIFTSMIAHCLINGISVIFQYFLTGGSGIASATVDEMESTPVTALSPVFWIILTVIAVVTLILAVIVMLKMAEGCGRKAYFRSLFRGKDRDRLKLREAKFWSWYLLGGILIALLFMILLLFI